MTANTSPATGLWRWVELSRVHMFAGSMLGFWPFSWSMTMAARSSSLTLSTYFFSLAYGLIGAALTHSAGCVWNDILDRKFDRQVERTKRRPIADGRVSVLGALVFLAIHLVAIVAMLWPANPLTWWLGLATVFPLAGMYPLMKRVTYWPQAWLSVGINLPSLLAWGTIYGELSLASQVLLFGCCCWTLYYDTIYACQDKRDDVQAGIKSTALLFGAHVKTILAVLAALLVVFLTTAGTLNEHGMPFFVLTVGGATTHLIMQLQNLHVDDPKNCLAVFESNAFTFGGIVWAGLFVDYIFG
ncbi:4-hydroxybenzoate polyprenyl transferase [Multifurca ochricompacta]|uniref:4-hydroxybenzoate polyprenyltransferase, mitochondrial n=1 Tax=Multifurca ochricompacta TaxID=376703 RepID=A0AAD4LVJ0_9AGAM|nr:4-hydroxybenzoate polyprenyl transferase [Multifurca ochricompacta]